MKGYGEGLTVLADVEGGERAEGADGGRQEENDVLTQIQLRQLLKRED